ncbi:TonB family protein [Mangrovivirga cuniculi]|nr:energy transducer TonB [Mangrovivirga cuniculi]
MNIRIIFLGLLLIPVLGISQSRTITGRLLDSETKQPVRYAEININDGDSILVTNHLGYFQTEYEYGDKLMASHIGYETSEIPVPESSSFAVLMNKSYTDLGQMTFDEKELAESGITREIHANELDSGKNNVKYKESWQEFYADFIEMVTSAPTFKDSLGAYTLEVYFTVNEKGQVRDILIDDTKSYQAFQQKGLIEESLMNLNSWIPATQNGINTSQSFKVSIISVEKVFTLVEESAKFPGGMDAWYNYLKDELNYPSDARRLGIQGRVYVEFVVQRDGGLTNIKIAKGIGGGCDEEVIRIIKNSPNWIPAYYKGEPVVSKTIFPVTFKLDYGDGRSNSTPKLQDYLRSNVRYPAQARRMGIEGTLYVFFHVNKRGVMSDLKIINDIGANCGAELLTQMKNVPPVMIKNLKQGVNILPVTFGLHDPPEKRKKLMYLKITTYWKSW